MRRPVLTALRIGAIKIWTRAVGRLLLTQGREAYTFVAYGRPNAHQMRSFLTGAVGALPCYRQRWY